MNFEKEKLKFLEQTTLPRILIYLLETEKASRTDLVRNIQGSQGAIYNALPILLEKGLIEEKTSEGFPRRINIWLTEKGKKVATPLISILESLSDNS